MDKMRLVVFAGLLEVTTVAGHFRYAPNWVEEVLCFGKTPLLPNVADLSTVSVDNATSCVWIGRSGYYMLCRYAPR